MNYRRRASLASLLGAFVLLAPAASAHERWVHHDLIRPFDRTLFETVCWTNGLSGLLVVAGALFLRHLAKRRESWLRVTGREGDIERRVGPLLPWCPTLMRWAYGSTLVVFALRGEYLAPDLRAGASAEGQLLIGIAITVGALLVVGWRTRVSAFLSVLVYVWAVVSCPFEAFDLRAISALDVLIYSQVLGIGLYLAIVGAGRLSIDSLRKTKPDLDVEVRDVGRALCRVALGATLCLLGLVKFLVPELFMGVVQNYPEIFHRPFEEVFGATEEEVVFGASVIEFSVGLLLALGLFTRVLVLVLGALFTTTGILFDEEVLGHLPLVGMVLVLLVEGGGSLRLLRERATAVWRDPDKLRRFVPRLSVRSKVRPVSAFMAEAVVFGLACGATLYGLQPSLAAAGPRQNTLGPAQESGVYAGQKGRCSFALELSPAAIELNRLFSIACTVRDVETGQLLDDLDLEIDVTMPQHGHGMPTEPRTEELRPGRFLTRGCKLNMHGSWIVQVKALRNGELLDRSSTILDFRPPE